MANISAIVPTKNISDFNVNFIQILIAQEFPQFDVEIVDGDIHVLYKGNRVTDIYFNTNSSWLLGNLEADVIELEQNGKTDLAQKLRELIQLNPDLSNTIETRNSAFHLEKNSIDQLLREYFSAYIFDEGIHPEFMPPDYESKMTLRYKKQNPTGSGKVIKKFKNFFKRS